MSNDEAIRTGRAQLEIFGNADHTAIKAYRGGIVQQLDLTQGEVIDLWQKIGVRYNLAGMRDALEAGMTAGHSSSLTHLENYAGRRAGLIQHLAYAPHHSDNGLGQLSLADRTDDELLRKHAELHGVKPS